MNTLDIIVSQYRASLAMLAQTVQECPEEIWDSPDDKTKFWHIAYHVLFYTHLYLQDAHQDFVPWPKHRPDYHSLDRVPRSLDSPQGTDEPYDKDAILEYLTFCQQQVAERVPGLNLEAGSGFDWLPFNKLELQIYTIRHIQQHAGELMERLGSRAGIEIDWVGQKHE